MPGRHAGRDHDARRRHGRRPRRRSRSTVTPSREIGGLDVAAPPGPARRPARRGLDGLAVEARRRAERDDHVHAPVPGPGASSRCRIADLVGTKGILRDPKLERERGWFSSHDALSIVVDLRAPSTGIGSDADLRFRLTQAGVDPAALDAAAHAAVARRAARVGRRAPAGRQHTRTYDAHDGSDLDLPRFAGPDRLGPDREGRHRSDARAARRRCSCWPRPRAPAATGAARRSACGSTHVEQERAPLM